MTFEGMNFTKQPLVAVPRPVAAGDPECKTLVSRNSTTDPAAIRFQVAVSLYCSRARAVPARYQKYMLVRRKVSSFMFIESNSTPPAELRPPNRSTLLPTS